MIKRILIFLALGLSLAANVCANKSIELRAGEWEIEAIECQAEAIEPAKQSFVDSCITFINHPSFSDKETFSYVFTENELLMTRKGKTERWAYKISGEKLIVDLGGGKVYILDFKVDKNKLTLILNKDLFFKSEFAQKNIELKSAVKTLNVLFHFNKK